MRRASRDGTRTVYSDRRDVHDVRSGAITGAIATIAASKGHPVERSISLAQGAH